MCRYGGKPGVRQCDLKHLQLLGICDVALSLEAHLDGAEITEYREGKVAIPVIFQSVNEERQVFGDFWNLNVSSATRGVHVPLMPIAS